MEIIRLKKENSILEKKKKELLNQIHDLMTKNNSLNQEILSLRYSNKNSGVSHQSNNNTINELNKTISTLKSRINQITKEKSDLEKKNNELKLTINSYKNEKQKLLNNINNNNNKNCNLSEMKKMNDILNKNLINLENEKKNLKKTINELNEQNNNINKQINDLKNDNEKLNKIQEEYKEKFNKITKELSDEKDINIFNEQKIKKLERKLEEYQINEIDEQKTKTYKIGPINKVNEIEMEKLTKKGYNSPIYHKNTSTFSTNTTTNRIMLINNFEETEITPENYTIIKQFKLTDNLKWYLLKKLKKNNSSRKEENSPSLNNGFKHPSRRIKYLKLNSKSNNNIYNDDSYSDFIWKSNKNEKDFINFNTEIINKDFGDSFTNKENQKKITELESNIKELEQKLEKKVNDCNRINLNYAKLFNRSRMPEVPYDKLLENFDKLREENKNLKKKIENYELNQNFIGLSFIEDDLNGSLFIDDNCFEKILDELVDDKNFKDNSSYNKNMMKFFRSHEDDKDNKDVKNNYKNVNKYFYCKKRDDNKCSNFTNYNSNYNTKSPYKFHTIKSKTNIKYNYDKETINLEENNKKDINRINSNFRRTYHKSSKAKIALENDINENKDEKNIQVNLDKKFLRSEKNIKFEKEDKVNEEKDKKKKTIEEDTIKTNVFYRRRKFYRKEQSDL